MEAPAAALDEPGAPDQHHEPAAQKSDGPDEEPDPLAALRRAAEEASAAEHDTGVSDPFRLDDPGSGGRAG
jgi:hypothetical protein